jgi:hypothetical protein
LAGDIEGDGVVDETEKYLEGLRGKKSPQEGIKDGDPQQAALAQFCQSKLDFPADGLLRCPTTGL